MPLKHFTETFLVVVLGVVIAITGLLVATLPDLPAGALPWTVLFVLSVIYPLVLMPLFRKRRADYLFRLLHWFPSWMLLGWLILQGIAFYTSINMEAFSSYTWAWSFGPAVLGFILLILFCLSVIRRWIPRVVWLLVLFIPFAAMGIFSELEEQDYEKELAAVLWNHEFWNVLEEQTGGLIADLSGSSSSSVVSSAKSERNLDPSEDPKEEEWRERMRMQEQRQNRIAERLAQRDRSSSSVIASVDSSSSTAFSDDMVAMVNHSESSAASELSGTGQELRDAVTQPDLLPSSGFGFGAFGVVMIAGYCGTMHRRIRSYRSV